ncbi:MAG: preprotein translocase subunit SecG [Planctomycetota bacterium]
MGSGDLTKWIDMALTGLFVVSGLIMIFFILLQEGKGGGLTALGGTKAAGVEGVTNPIRRATVYMAILFFLLAIILGIMHAPRESIKIGSGTPAAAKQEPAPSASPVPPPVQSLGTVLEPKKEEKSAEPQKAEAKKEGPPAEPKKDEAKKEEPAAEPKKDEAKKDEPAAEPKKDEAKKDEPAAEPKKN